MSRFELSVKGILVDGRETSWSKWKSYKSKRAAEQAINDLHDQFKTYFHARKWRIRDTYSNDTSIYG